MKQWLKASGRLKYDPVRVDRKAVAKKQKAGNVDENFTGFRKAHKTRTLIVELPRDELDAYYRWFITRKHGSYLELQPPMWGKHVTVVKGTERIPKLEHWKKHEGQVVEFEYCPELIRNHWRFWSLAVRGNDLTALRLELGLWPLKDMHITIGRQYEWQPLLNKEKE